MLFLCDVGSDYFGDVRIFFVALFLRINSGRLDAVFCPGYTDCQFFSILDGGLYRDYQTCFTLS
ncbi:hypothetical protein DSUL_150055 [Desulfovibrionales bacterium]